MGLEAEIFKWLRDSVCPKAFKWARAEYKDAVVIDDLLTFLHRIWNPRDGGLLTGSHVFHEVNSRLGRMWEEGAEAYVACMDIQQLMPPAKFPEQAARDGDRKIAKYPDTATITDDGIVLPGRGGHAESFSMNTILSSRSGARQALFRYLGGSFA